ncbi:hypothetical protein CHISP_0635 [Chitinispirillum alkaliphilum]|nr:hypothetical protein CHISP_0635 [Chitinispirillum alkaliphilum]
MSMNFVGFAKKKIVFAQNSTFSCKKKNHQYTNNRLSLIQNKKTDYFSMLYSI